MIWEQRVKYIIHANKKRDEVEWEEKRNEKTVSAFRAPASTLNETDRRNL